VDWNLTPERNELLQFTRRVINLRRTHPVFRRTTFFKGQFLEKSRALKDVAWISPEGREMGDADWGNPEGRSLGMYIAGDCLDGTYQHGEPIEDNSFLFLMNAAPTPVGFRLPRMRPGTEWSLVLHTAAEVAFSPREWVVTMPRNSAALLMEVPAEDPSLH